MKSRLEILDLGILSNAYGFAAAIGTGQNTQGQVLTEIVNTMAKSESLIRGLLLAGDSGIDGELTQVIKSMDKLKRYFLEQVEAQEIPLAPAEEPFDDTPDEDFQPVVPEQTNANPSLAFNPVTGKHEVLIGGG